MRYISLYIILCIFILPFKTSAETTWNLEKTRRLNEQEKEKNLPPSYNAAISHKVTPYPSVISEITLQNMVYFWGRAVLRQEDSTNKAPMQLWSLSLKTQEVTPVFSKEQYEKFLAGPYPDRADFVVSPDGRFLALGHYQDNYTAQKSALDKKMTTSDLLLFDLETKQVRTLVSDGAYNYSYVFSPDGKHLAYYADSAENFTSTVESSRGAARIVNVQTGEIRTVGGFYQDVGGGPERISGLLWLDNDRVFFPLAYLPSVHDGNFSLCGAIAHISKRTTKQIREVGALVLVDKKKQRLFFSDMKKITSSDFDGENASVVHEGKHYNLRLENDVLQYDAQPDVRTP